MGGFAATMGMSHCHKIGKWLLMLDMYVSWLTLLADTVVAAATATVVMWPIPLVCGKNIKNCLFLKGVISQKMVCRSIDRRC